MSAKAIYTVLSFSLWWLQEQWKLSLIFILLWNKDFLILMQPTQPRFIRKKSFADSAYVH